MASKFISKNLGHYDQSFQPFSRALIQNDLLKFRRGIARGQIEVGVLLQPFYYDTYYY